MHPSAHATARRSLVQRVERFLDALTASGRNPDYWECVHLVQALDCLDVEDFARGERAMVTAERPPGARVPLAGADSPTTLEIPTITRLRARMEDILKGVAKTQ